MPPESIAAQLPEALLRGGVIVRRQSSFWSLMGAAEASLWRASFVAKRAFHCADRRFDHAALLDEHPLLLDYVEPSGNLYLCGHVRDAAVAALRLRALVTDQFWGFRPRRNYLNDEYGLERLLAGGHGQVAAAPHSFLGGAQAVLASHGGRSTIVGRYRRSEDPPRLRLLGRSYVIAGAFNFVRAGP